MRITYREVLAKEVGRGARQNNFTFGENDEQPAYGFRGDP
jgi:hypothetical protein